LRLEVWRILAAPGGSRGLELLDATGAGSLLFGSGFTRALPVCMTSHRRTQLLFATLAASSLPLAALLTVTVEQGLDRQTLLLWHDCLRQVDPRLPLALGQDWRFSRLAMRRLAALSSITPDYWDELLVLPRRPRSLDHQLVFFDAEEAVGPRIDDRDGPGVFGQRRHRRLPARAQAALRGGAPKLGV
jgi:hypothetical protein